MSQPANKQASRALRTALVYPYTMAGIGLLITSAVFSILIEGFSTP